VYDLYEAYEKNKKEGNHFDEMDIVRTLWAYHCFHNQAENKPQGYFQLMLSMQT
jgi:hypothetical protein